MKDSSSPARRPRLDVVEPSPAVRQEMFWRRTTEVAIVGIFFLLALSALQFSRALLLPVTLAVVIGLMMAPLVTRMTKARISPWLGSFLLVAIFIAILSALLIELSGLVADWAKKPDIGATLREKLQLLDRPLAALRDLQGGISGPLGIDVGAMKFDVTSNFVAPVLSILTPAIGQLVLFFATLFFFLASHGRLRRYFIALSEKRRDRLRALRIFNDVERNLSRYVGVLTLINLGIGVLTMLIATFVGFPNPAAFGALAFGLNYVPLIGPAIMATTLLVAGLVVFRGAVRHAEHRRTANDDEPVPDFSVGSVLGVAVGPARRVTRDAMSDCIRGRARTLLSVQ
jgi:predicted PurR-regulated permease PerM